jgi:uncharacterized Zn finger protein (UPF0148 family)
MTDTPTLRGTLLTTPTIHCRACGMRFVTDQWQGAICAVCDYKRGLITDQELLTWLNTKAQHDCRNDDAWRGTR